MALESIPDHDLTPALWRLTWREHRIELTDEQRETLADTARRYRRRWGLRQEDMAREFECSPTTYAPVERAGAFASLRLLALIERRPIDQVPTRCGAKVLHIATRRDLERARDEAHRTWINAGMPDNGPVKTAADAAWAAIATHVGSGPAAAPSEPASAEPARDEAPPQRGKDDVEFPF